MIVHNRLDFYVVGRASVGRLLVEEVELKPLRVDPSKSLDERTSVSYGKSRSCQLSLEEYLAASPVVAPNACFIGGQEEIEGREQGPRGEAADVTA